MMLPTPDGFMIPGVHARTFEGNLAGGTRSSVSLVVSGGEGLLVDAGIGEVSFRAVIRMVETARCRLTCIVLTHDHFDHAANAARLRERFGAQVLAHAADAPMIENPTLLFSEEASRRVPGFSVEALRTAMNMGEAQWRAYRGTIERRLCHPVRCDGTVAEGDVLRVGESALRVFHMPGHSPGGVSLYNPETGALYAGDLALAPRRPWPVGDVRASRASLTRALGLSVRYLAPGHGGPFAGAGAARAYLLGTLGRLIVEERLTLAALAKGGALNVTEVADRVFPGHTRHPEYPGSDFGAYCHLAALEAEGVAMRVIKAA